ncbi:cyclic lactone autoinducer peptide [Butyrivibrio sp. M55]|nr:cyclic lactone autoinducer peptide [Butyrivibrio sp. M55]SFU84128.1 cyclic lactone autoinducer peptide [Butyrivibrio sp. M55]
MKREKTFIAKMLREIARKSVKVSSDSRCMYIMHQPKMPSDVGRIQ